MKYLLLVSIYNKASFYSKCVMIKAEVKVPYLSSIEQLISTIRYVVQQRAEKISYIVLITASAAHNVDSIV